MGYADKEIAAELQTSAATVRTHLRRLYARNAFRNRAEAASGWSRAL
jgi:DNA-binding CsgD family transcriptional regulator